MSTKGPDIAPDLFERAKAGEKRAVDVVLAALRPAMVTRAREYLGKHPDDYFSDSEDVAQEALLAVWQNIASIEKPADLVSFGLKAALNKAKDVRKTNHRRRERVVVSSPIVDATTEDGRPYSEFGTVLDAGSYRTPASHINYDGDDTNE